MRQRCGKGLGVCAAGSPAVPNGRALLPVQAARHRAPKQLACQARGRSRRLPPGHRRRTSAARLGAASGASRRTYAQYSRMRTSRVMSCHRPPWPWLTLNTAASCANATILASCSVTPRVCGKGGTSGEHRCGLGMLRGPGRALARGHARSLGGRQNARRWERRTQRGSVLWARRAAGARRLPALPRARGRPGWWPAAPSRRGQTSRWPGQTQRCRASTPSPAPAPSQTARRSGRQSCGRRKKGRSLLVHSLEHQDKGPSSSTSRPSWCRQPGGARADAARHRSTQAAWQCAASPAPPHLVWYPSEGTHSP